MVDGLRIAVYPTPMEYRVSKLGVLGMLGKNGVVIVSQRDRAKRPKNLLLVLIS